MLAIIYARLVTPTPSPTNDNGAPIDVDLPANPFTCLILAGVALLLFYGARHKLFGDQSKGDWK